MESVSDFFLCRKYRSDISGITTEAPYGAALICERHVCIEICISLCTLLSCRNYRCNISGITTKAPYGAALICERHMCIEISAFVMRTFLLTKFFKNTSVLQQNSRKNKNICRKIHKRKVRICGAGGAYAMIQEISFRSFRLRVLS